MLIRAKVNAGARRESVVQTAKGVNPGKSDFGKAVRDEFVVHVKEKAEDNAANDRLRVLIARHYYVPPSSVRIISGHQKGSKVLRVIK